MKSLLENCPNLKNIYFDGTLYRLQKQPEELLNMVEDDFVPSEDSNDEISVSVAEKNIRTAPLRITIKCWEPASSTLINQM